MTSPGGRISLLALLCGPLLGAGCGEPKGDGNGEKGEATGEGGGEAKEQGARKGGFEKRVFQGIRYTTPAGANIASSGVDRPSHYPDPQTGEVVEIPTRIEPAIAVTGTAAGGFYMIDIRKPPEKVTLDGMIASLQQVPEASALEGKPEANGWSLTYQWRNADGTSTTMRHRHYVMPDSDYDCIYDEGNTKDLEAARAICASIEAPPPPIRK